MKSLARLLKTLLVALSLGAALPLAAQPAPGGPAPKPGKGAPAPKKEAEPTIKGIVLNRPKGGFLGLTLEGNNFKLAFYDAKKKPAKVDVSLATARWPVHYSIYDERTVLTPNADGTALTSLKYVRPPYAFKLYLSLFKEGNPNAVESYVIDFHQ
jgi:hypothetical protein